MNELSYCSSNLGYEMYDSFSMTSILRHENEALFKNSAMYRMCCVISGGGFISHSGETLPLAESDVIIIPPACSAHLYGDDLVVLSVCVKGREMNTYSEELGFTKVVKKISQLSTVLELWKTLGEPGASMMRSVRAKGVVLYTISEIHTTFCGDESDRVDSVATRIKEYVDNNFINEELSLKTIGEELSYHPNYVSKVFKNEFGINIAKYVNIMRIRYSRILIDEGEISVKRIAQLSGFSDEEYFSSVFKKIVGETPREYIKRNQNYGSIM